MTKNLMAATSLVAALGLTLPGLAAAQGSHDAHHGAASPATQASAAPAEGTVKRIDRSGAKLTIAHGPLESLAMPPMTMAFKVADSAMLDQVKVGDKIRFTAERVGGVLTVTTLETAP